jgi:hypothetical protein
VRKFLEHGHVEHHVGQVEHVVDEGRRDKDVRVISARDGFWPPEWHRRGLHDARWGCLGKEPTAARCAPMSHWRLGTPFETEGWSRHHHRSRG